MPETSRHQLFAARGVVTADGQRFLLRMPIAESAPITVVVNWMNGLNAD